MATFDERLKKLRSKKNTSSDFDERLKKLRAKQSGSSDFDERLKRLREGGPAPIRVTAPEEPEEEGFFESVAKGIVRPAVKSFLAPGIFINSLISGREPEEKLTIPLLGDVTPPKTAREALGTFGETALLGVGGGVGVSGLKQAGKQTGKQLAKTLFKTGLREAPVGAGFGLSTALSENRKGKELITPTLTGAGLSFLTPALAKGVGVAGKKLLIQPAKKGLVLAKQSLGKLANSAPVKAISSIGARLKKFGEPGKELLKGFEKIDKESLIRIGTSLDNLDDIGFNNINKKQSLSLLDALEGRTKREELTVGVRSIFDVVDSLRNEVADESTKIGLKIRLKKGLEVPFKGRKDFFPHFIPQPDDLKPKRLGINKLREEVVENTVRTGKFKTKELAEQVLDSYIDFTEKEGRGGQFWINWLVESGQAQSKDEARGLAMKLFRRSRLPKFGNLEQAREINFPFYDPEPRRAITKYLTGSFERLETVKEFGRKSEKINKLLGKIQRLQGRESGQEARRLLDRATGKIDSAPSAEKFSLFLRSLNVPKLAFAQIANVGQPIVNGSLKADIPSLAFGIKAALTKTGRKRALRAGTTLDSVINETIRKAGTEGSFGSKFLKLTGFAATEKFNRVVAANTGMRYLERTAGKLIKQPSNKVLRSRILELGLDPDDIIRKGLKGISEKDLLTAGQKFTNITQFRGRPIDLPAFAQSPEGKVLFQFKTFAFSQTKLLKDQIVNDLENQNYTGALKTLLILGTIFPMTGEVTEDVKALVTRKPRDTEGIERYLQNIVATGGLGIAADLWRSAEFGSLVESLAGPTLSTVGRGVERAVQDINKGRVTDASIKYLMDQFGVLRPLKNEIFKK